MQFKLEDYQVDLYNKLLTEDRVFNMLDMGMGKTLPSLLAVRDDLIASKALLITKENILHSWVNDNDKFDLGLNIKLPIGNKSKRNKIMLEILDSIDEVDLVGISVFNIDWFVNNFISAIEHFDTLIIDESTLFKNRNTNRYKHLLELIRVKHFYKIWLLSGTPNLGFEALYNQVFILDNGKRLGKTLTRFRNTYMRKHPFIKHVWEDKKEYEGQIINAIKDISFNAIKDSGFSFNYNYLNANNNYEDELKELINTRIFNGELVSNPATLYIRVMQVLAMNDSKLSALISHIKANKVKNAIIVSNVVELKNKAFYELSKHFKGVHIYNKSKSKDIENAFNTNNINYLIVHSDNISHGLNLQHSQAYNIYYLSPYGIGLDGYLQLNKRLARRGNNNMQINVNHIYNDELELKYYKDLVSGKFNMDKFLNYIWYNSSVKTN